MAARLARLRAGRALCAATAASLGLAAASGRGRIRRSVHRRATSTSLEQKRIREEASQATVEAATPVPQSFEQSVSWACSAVMEAAEKGQTRQTVYFSAGASDSQVGGALGAVLPFAEQFVKAMASIQAAQGGVVRVLFSDLGAKSSCQNRWEPLPKGLVLDYFPPMLRGQEAATGEDKFRLLEILQADMLIAVATTQTELPALLYLMQEMKNTGTEVPLVLVNARLISNTYVAAGALLKQYRSFEKSLTPTFHLEQYDPAEDSGLNSAVIARVYPRPFSVWEDNPNDPEAIDGFFLLEISDADMPSIEAVEELLKASKDISQKMLQLAARD